MLTRLIWGDHYRMYTYIESVCGTSETNIILYVNYISIFKVSINMLDSYVWQGEGIREPSTCGPQAQLAILQRTGLIGYKEEPGKRIYII